MIRKEFNSSWLFRKQDGEQQVITLPHDASLLEGREPDAPGGTAHGFFLGGFYEYENTFDIPDNWGAKSMMFEFGGIYKNSEVYINENLVGGCAFGYSEFAVDATPYLKVGARNTIRVTADNRDLPNSRWYSGAGIYRPVYMLIGEENHIKRRGVKITTMDINPPKICVETACTGGEITVEIFDQGQCIATSSGTKEEIELPSAKLWSAESPQLYECRVTLRAGAQDIETVSEWFGIRQIKWSNKGLFINGNETLLQGACVHSDNGILGVASFQKSEERRVRILKENGYNAIRASHNPASEFMLEACDKLGMYVMDETWDVWYNHKTKYDYAGDFHDNYRFDVASLVERDYNHPSVIMYSIGNEISEPATQKGVDLTKELVAEFKKLDQTRAVTAGVNLMIINRSAKGNPIFKEDGSGLSNKSDSTKNMNSTMFNLMTSIVGTGMNKAVNSKKADAVTKPCLDTLDIAGYNYASGRYPLEAKANPKRIVVGSETFPSDVVKNWKMVQKLPYLIGDFMWTGWDYIGEAGIGSWAYTNDAKTFAKPYPWLLADVGAFDILGNPNGEAFLAKTLWGASKEPIIAVRPVNKDSKPIKSVWRGTNALPSWSWQGCEGKTAIVEVYSDAAYIELSLNKRKLGKKKVKNYVATFKIKYEAGVLGAIAFDEGQNKLGKSSLISSKGEITIKAIPEENVIQVNDIAYIPITLVGENDQVESNADRPLSVTVENGELLGFGSANPRTEESYMDGTFASYYGRAQAVVRGRKAGNMTVTVTAKDVKTTCSIQVIQEKISED